MKLGGRRLHLVRACLAAMLAMIVVGLSPVRAVEAINVRTDARAIDLTDAAERHRTETDRLLVSAAPGPDGIIRRMDAVFFAAAVPLGLLFTRSWVSPLFDSVGG